MKFAYSLVILAVLGLSAAQSDETTRPTEPTPDAGFACPGEGFYPYDGDCTKFYDCTNGLAWLLQCPDGLYFDFKSQQCDFPANVDCPFNMALFKHLTVKGQVCDEKVDFECPGNGAFEHEIYCDYYYDCYEGVAFSCRCTDGLLFSNVYHGCDYPESVDCGPRIPSDNTTRPTQASPKPTTPAMTYPTDYTGPTPVTPGEFVCPKPDGLFRDPADCNGFYQCVSNVAYHNNCPPELVFNEAISACDFPENVPGCEA